MSHRYDELTLERMRRSTGAKWNHYPEHLIPLWVADMDFPVAEPIREAIRRHTLTDDFGYPTAHGLPGFKDAVIRHLRERHGIEYTADEIAPVSGIIPALYASSLALAAPGDEIIVQPPVYPPFFMAVENTQRLITENPMVQTDAGWELDLDGLESVITPATRCLIFCNPQNPTGRVFTHTELERLAEIVLRHNLWVISDELHGDLVLDGRYIPLASVSPEMAQRTVTLYGPTKAFNIAGLKVGFVLCKNPALLARIRKLMGGLVTPPNVLAQAAATAAFNECGDWLQDTLDYVRGNRDLLVEFVRNRLPGVGLIPPEGTYLAWLDFRTAIARDQLKHVLEEDAKVALNLGDDYRTGGAGFARINLATSRGILTEALERIEAAVRRHQSHWLAGKADGEPVA